MPLFQSPPQLPMQQGRVTHIWPDRARRVWCQGTATLGFRRMAEQSHHKQHQVKISGPGVSAGTMTDGFACVSRKAKEAR